MDRMDRSEPSANVLDEVLCVKFSKIGVHRLLDPRHPQVTVLINVA